MTLRRAHALAGWLTAAAVALPGAAAAQSFVPQPQQYLLTTQAFDARALWVQPAGLVRTREASVSVMATVNRLPGKTRVGQYGVTLASGILGLGWQHDRLAGGAKGDVIIAGLAGGSPEISVGFDHRWHSGTNTRKDGAWDIGAHYAATERLSVSLVWRDIGSPVVVRDSANADTIRATIVPAAALRLARGRVVVGADWEIVTSGGGTSAIRAGAMVVLPANLLLGIRGEFTGSLSGRGVAISLTWNGRGARVTAYQASVRMPDPDRVGVWGSAVSSALTPRRRRMGS